MVYTVVKETPKYVFTIALFFSYTKRLKHGPTDTGVKRFSVTEHRL